MLLRISTACVALLALGSAAQAQDMRSYLEGKSTGCAMDSFFFSKSGRLMWLTEDTPDRGPSASLRGSAVLTNSATRLDVRIQEPLRKRLVTLSFRRNGRFVSIYRNDQLECDRGQLEAGTRAALHTQDVALGYHCEGQDTPTRAEMPGVKACRALLKRLCGSNPTNACAQKNRAKLASARKSR